MHSTQAPEAPERPRGSVTNAISNLVVRLLNEYTGRGPTRARTYMQDDLISVVMRDTLTKAERSLAEQGRGEHVRQSRRFLQETMRGELVAGVERLSGRKVIAFLSDNHLDPDIAVETLVLEPRPTQEQPETGQDNGQGG